MKKIYLIISIVMLVIYISGPVIAATFEIGNRWGPKIYPVWLHELIYCLTWSFSAHDSKKPRVGYWEKEEYRPWFYGVKSKNNDPEYVEQEVNRVHRKYGLPSLETLGDSQQ